MMKFSNELTEAQSERLAYLAEECSEVIKICMKTMRHGYESRNPDKPEKGTNRQMLEAELADVNRASQMLIDCADVSQFAIDANYEISEVKTKYFHHQDAEVEREF